MAWFSALFRARSVPPAGDDGDGDDKAGLTQEAIAELGEGLQKVARLQARQGVRLEEIENKVEGGFSDLRAAVRQVAAPGSPTPIAWDDLLDAADALDEAERAAEASGDGAMAQGLRAVGSRLGRFLIQRGVRREKRVGAAPDPALVRVIGTVDTTAVQEGCVARVVRAAVTEKGQLLREGEVLIARSLAAGPREEVSP